VRLRAGARGLQRKARWRQRGIEPFKTEGYICVANKLRKMKNLGFALVFTLFSTIAGATEGMWIPSLLSAAQIGEMQSKGLKLSAEDIYSVNKGSLKDAIFQFGGGCTAEVISPEGLILTNHHCGYSQVQSHSSLEHDYLTDGFWAMTRAQELPNPGLTAMFVVRIEDVTDQVLMGANAGSISSADMEKRVQAIIQKATMATYYEAEVLPFNYGNAYFLIVTETYNDVRLVGAPPSSIGKYGHDTDNWIWPRHTGDFSMFRIYANKDNRPADYSPDNVPLKPRHFLPISMEGVKEGDFTMVYGFPGRTQQFLPSYAVDYILNYGNPAKIGMRDRSLAVINAAMKADKQVNIQYAAKQSRIANSWKKMIGESFGLNRVNAIAKKQEFEKEFNKLAMQQESHKPYRDVLEKMKMLYGQDRDLNLAYDYYVEFVFFGPEILRYVQSFQKLVDNYATMSDEERAKEVAQLKSNAEGYFKNYVASVDADIMRTQLEFFMKGVKADYIPAELSQGHTRVKGDAGLYVTNLYQLTQFMSKDRVDALLARVSSKTIKKIAADPAYKLSIALYGMLRGTLGPEHGKLTQQITNQLYMYVKGIRAMMPDRTYWYDANSTLRLTYGEVEGSSPMDGMRYEPFATLDGVLQKYKRGDYEYDLPAKLLDLHARRDYGPYAENGKLIVCFTGSNHTTGGNSGSPAINGEGHLIGLNFDRSWESTMSDVMYNPDICRNIMVDVRYVLFIVDKFAGAGHLLKEMVLVTPEYRKEQRDKAVSGRIEAVSARIRGNANSPDLLSERGNLYLELGMNTEALNDFEAAIRADKRYAAAYMGRGKAELANGNCEASVQTFTKAIEVDKSNPEAHFSKGLALFEKGDYKQAIGAFGQAIQLKPDHYKAYYNRGICQHLLGKIPEGCSDLDMAQKLGGNREEWIFESVCK
jgi:tetratricopeptide (TPR) repeat protein